MPTAARLARPFVLIMAALVAAGGDSLALPVAHLFADHHHVIFFSPANGNWQWVAVADHHDDAAALSVGHHGHDHEIRETAVPFRLGNTAGLSLALIPAASLDGGDDPRGAAQLRGSPDPPPDIGKPDLALLASMRV